jgi:methylated-DNA-[protein]-cysteine S-methyltransferase
MTPLPDTLLEAVAAAAVREGLADAVFTRLRTPIGRLLVVQGERGVVRVGFEEEPEDRVLAEVAERLGPRIVGSDRELAVTRDTLEAYFAGEGDPQGLPVDLSLVAAPFRHAVLETLHDEIPRGQVVTYGALANRAGNPRAHRAAATACARNPVPILVPCHRVLPSGGGIGEYGGGRERKRALLELEGSLPVKFPPARP